MGNFFDFPKHIDYYTVYMPLTQKDRVAGGQAVHKKYGSEYMRKLGKRGRKKQLKAKV